MKTKINHYLILFLFALLSFTSCQDETAEIDNPNEQETIAPDSALANLIANTTANFGGIDDFLDASSCFSVELPVTIIVNDVTITIDNEEDLEEIEDLFEDFYGDNIDDDNFLDFVFPITIIFSDYSEIVIENEDELENLIAECDIDEDDSIECVDFVYPISFSVFNSEFNLINTIIIENDEALHTFLDDLEDDDNALIVSINYPVTLIYANGETLEVTSNQELAEAIEAAEDDCDDDDDDCIEEEVAINLVECPWEVFLYTNDDLENIDGPYIFTFNENGNVIIDGVFPDPYTTNWELTETDNGLELNIESFYYYEQQFGNWLVVECDDDDLEFEHLTVDGTGLFFDQDCEDDLDCSLTDISNILQECPWDFTNGTGNFNNYQMIFNENGNLQITEGETTSAIGGMWNLSVSDEGLILNFSELTAFQDTLGGDWLIVECNEDGELTIVRGNAVFELEQNCYDSVFDCFEDFEIVECVQPNNVPVYNLSAGTIGLVNCTESFIASFHTTLIDAENNVNPIPNTEAYGTLTTQVYLRIEADSGNFEVFTIYLNTEDCNLFECFESFDAVIEVCDNGTDGPYTFDLTIAFANCTPSADVVTYYETQADAEAGTNPIANPEAYTSVAVQQTIYIRVEIDNQFQVFPIQLLIVDCNNGDCSETDVDGFLLECIWNVLSFNGSDNLMEWNFDFESANNTVVIYTDTETIDAIWMTTETSDGVVIEFSNVAGPNIQAINGSWLVVECTANQLILHDVNNSDNELVLDRNCD